MANPTSSRLVWPSLGLQYDDQPSCPLPPPLPAVQMLGSLASRQAQHTSPHGVHHRPLPSSSPVPKPQHSVSFTIGPQLQKTFVYPTGKMAIHARDDAPTPTTCVASLSRPSTMSAATSRPRHVETIFMLRIPKRPESFQYRYLLSLPVSLWYLFQLPSRRPPDQLDKPDYPRSTPISRFILRHRPSQSCSLRTR